MGRMWVIIAATLAVGVIWVVAASAILCLFLGRMDLFVFPWDQWVDDYWWIHTNWWAALLVIVSALLPIIPIGVATALLLIFLSGRRKPQQPLYGEMDWASRKKMRDSNLLTSRSLKL